MTEISIVGGGVSGLTLATLLSNKGLRPTVYEDRKSSSEGHYLTLAGQTFADLFRRQIDLSELSKVGAKVLSIRLVESDDVATFTRPPVDGFYHRNVWRGQLVESLENIASTAGVDIQKCARVTDIRRTGAGGIEFKAGGTARRSDILIGCDGSASVVRRHLLGPGYEPRYAGHSVVYAHTSKPIDDLVEPDVMYFFKAPEGTVGVLTTSDHGTYWFARFTRSEPVVRNQVGEQPANWWANLIQSLVVNINTPDATPIIRTLLASTSTVTVVNAREVPPLPQWATGSIAIIGDAAHGQSPAYGGGAASAINDAITISDAIGVHSSDVVPEDVFATVRTVLVEMRSAWPGAR